MYYTTQVNNNNQATVNIQTSIKNTTDQQTTVRIEQELFNKAMKSISKTSGKLNVPAGNDAGLSQNLDVKQPDLWSVENPNLYQLKTTVYKGKELIDKTVTNVGIRTLRFDADKGFFLNGKSMKVRGVCLHHDAGVSGPLQRRCGNTGAGQPVRPGHHAVWPLLGRSGQ